jgi:citrate/tricarballylate utilization protein
MFEDDVLAEADRLMTICNACRYCEGLCAVFPAMEMRTAFASGDLGYLANLCHNCGACSIDCPFSPPHQFAVNVPKTLATVRAQSYGEYAWPRFLAPLFLHNPLMLTVALPISIAGILLTMAGLDKPRGADFYALIPHDTLALLFGAVFLYSLFAMAMSGRTFWRKIGPAPAQSKLKQAIRRAVSDAATLRHLDGGGDGCSGEFGYRRDLRRLVHHLTAYGFLLCFGATSVATLYHYLLGREAPYAWWEPPVLLGSLGGIGLVLGPAGLLWEKFRRDPELSDQRMRGMEISFIVLLLLSGASGLLLTVLRETAAMPLLLALHLGTVLSFFLSLPYSKFVHGLYRFLALVRAAQERQG